MRGPSARTRIGAKMRSIMKHFGRKITYTSHVGIDVVPRDLRYVLINKIINFFRDDMGGGDSAKIAIVSPGSARRGRHPLYLRHGVHKRDAAAYQAVDLLIVDQANYYSREEFNRLNASSGLVVFLFDSRSAAERKWASKKIDHSFKWKK